MQRCLLSNFSVFEFDFPQHKSDPLKKKNSRVTKAISNKDPKHKHIFEIFKILKSLEMFAVSLKLLVLRIFKIQKASC